MTNPSDGERELDAASAAAERLLGGSATAVLNAVDQGIFCLNERGQATFVNEAATRMLGYTLREMAGRPIHALIHHHYADGTPFPIEASPIWSSVVDGIHQRVGGDVFWRKDGSALPVDYTSIPIREGRRIAAVVVTFRDVTSETEARRQGERLAAERAARLEAERGQRALREAEERFRLALAAGHMGTWEWDIAGGRVHWSAEEEAMYGLSPGTFSGTLEEYRERIHPDDRDSSLQLAQANLAAGAEVHHIVHRIVRPDGSVRWLDSHGRFTYAEDGTPLRLSGVSVDVTERMQMEQGLRDARAAADLARAESEHARREFERVFEQAPAAIATLEGESLRFRTVNARMLQLIGHRQLSGKPVREALPDLEGQPFFDLLERVYRTGEPFVGRGMKARVDRNGDGRLVEGTFDFVYQPLREVDGSITGIMVHATELQASETTA